MKRYIAYNPKYNDDKRHKTYFQHFTEIFSNFVGTHLMCDVTQRADPPPNMSHHVTICRRKPTLLKWLVHVEKTIERPSDYLEVLTDSLTLTLHFY